jgi:hypothetical protein
MGDEILRVPARVLAGEGIVEAVAKHAVVDLCGAHAVAPAAAVHQIRCAIHVLHASGDGDVHLAGRDLLRGGDDRLGAGTTNTVHRRGRNRHRQAATDRGLARRIHLVAGLDDVAHEDAADRRGVEPRAPQCLAHDGRTEVRRRDRLERTVVGTDRGTDGIAEDNLRCAHGTSPFLTDMATRLLRIRWWADKWPIAGDAA